MSKENTYFWNILITIDQAANVLFAPLLNRLPNVECKFGHPDETLSSVFAKNRKICTVCKWMCKMLHLIDPMHCEKSVESDRGYSSKYGKE